MLRLTAIAIFSLALVGAIALVLATIRGERRQRERRRTWALAARRLGGRVGRAPRSFLDPLGVVLVARIEETVLRARVVRRIVGHSTEIVAPAEGTCGLTLEIEPATSDGAGGQIQLRTNNADLARAWLEAPLAQKGGFWPPYRVTLSGGEVRAERDGVEGDAAALEAAAELVVSIAGQGREILRRARTLAAEIGGLISSRGTTWEPNGGVLTVVARAGSQVLVDHLLDRAGRTSGRARVLTRIRARSPWRLPSTFVIHGNRSLELGPGLAFLPLVPHQDRSFSSCFTLLGDDGEQLEERLTETLRRRLELLRPALVTGEGQEVTVLLEGLRLEAQPIRDAIDVAIELSSPEPVMPRES